MTKWIFISSLRPNLQTVNKASALFNQVGKRWRRFSLWIIQIRKDCLWQSSAAVFAVEDVDLTMSSSCFPSKLSAILRDCNARFNLLHRALHNHNESKAERVCLGDGQCRWWRRCSFNTSMMTWPRLGLSALGMTSAAVIRNALDHLKEVADKLQTLATSCEPTKCCPVKLWGTHILFNPWTRNTRWWWKTSNTHSISSRY